MVEFFRRPERSILDNSKGTLLITRPNIPADETFSFYLKIQNIQVSVNFVHILHWQDTAIFLNTKCPENIDINTFLNLYFHCEKKAELDSVLPSAWEYRPRSHADDTLISVSVEYLNIPRWRNISLFYYRVSPKKSRLKKNSGTGCPKKLLALARSHANNKHW